MTDKTKQSLNEYAKDIDAIRNKALKTKPLKAEEEVERLVNEKFYNPYDVLQLDASATDEQIRRQYKNFSLLVHPDKCKDIRAKEAWQNIEQAHKTLCDPDKRKVYLRIMRQARERTTFERDRENKRRTRQGQQELAPQTFQEQYQETCLKIFKDLEEKKEHLTRLQQSTFAKKMDLLETKKLVEQFRILTEEEWERSRDHRVANWRQFSKEKYMVGSRRSNGGIRPPPVLSEARPHYTTIEEKRKNI